MKQWLRWPILLFCVQVMMSATFCFDVPASLHNSLKSYFSGIALTIVDTMDSDEFELYYSGLYSIYSFANIFLPLITGKLRDSVGGNPIIVLSSLLMIFGQYIFVISVEAKSFPYMFLGRILFGWGFESLFPTLSGFYSLYFKADHYSLGMGFNHLFATIGLLANMFITPQIAANYGLITALMVGVYVALGGLVFAILTVITDQYIENFHFEPIPLEEPMEVEQVEQHSVSDKHTLFWLIAFYQSGLSVIVATIVSISVGYLTENWGGQVQNEIQAGRMVAIMWLISGGLTPFFGLINDRFGHRAFTVLISAMLALFGLSLMGFTSPQIMLILIGISYSLTWTSSWAGTIHIVREDEQGRSYSIYVCIFNIGLCILPFIIGILRSTQGDYRIALNVFVGLSGVILIFGSLVFIKDARMGNILDGHKTTGIMKTNTVYENENEYIQ